MKPRFGADDSDSLESGDLAEFEAALRRALEQRLVDAARKQGEPTRDEAAQLARMAAHIDAPDHAARERSLRRLPQSNSSTPALAEREGALAHDVPTSGRRGHGVPTLAGPVAPARPQRSPRRSLVLTWVPLAAVALGVVLVRGSGPGHGTPPAVDVTARGTDTGAVHPTSDVYLGAGTVAGGVFPGRLTWDAGGQDGVVRVAVFDRDGDPSVPVREQYVEGTEWTPTGSLPQRFRVVVDRPADDGVSREELLCADYCMP
jgi:hypothetical protein